MLQDLADMDIVLCELVVRNLLKELTSWIKSFASEAVLDGEGGMRSSDHAVVEDWLWTVALSQLCSIASCAASHSHMSAPKAVRTINTYDALAVVISGSVLWGTAAPGWAAASYSTPSNLNFIAIGDTQDWYGLFVDKGWKSLIDAICKKRVRCWSAPLK